MLNWGDKDSADRLAMQLKELLKERTMTYDQLASVYSIKHGQSVTQRLKEISRGKCELGVFLSQMPELFELVGKNQVKAQKAPAAAPPADAPAPAAAPKVPPWAKGTAAAAPEAPAVSAVPAAAPAPPKVEPESSDGAPSIMKYADVSRGIQNILKEVPGKISIPELEDLFKAKFRTTIDEVVGMDAGEYLQRKENIFDYDDDAQTVCLQGSILAGPPVAALNSVKDEVFVVKEFEQLVESMGPVVYISTLCGKFIQRNGVSVTSIISGRPLDLFKRHPQVFLIVGAGNVTLKKYEHLPEVARLLDKPSSKAQRTAKAAEESQLPIPEVVSEQDIVDEFRRLILSDGTDSVYISSLCGRFLQRYKKPVTGIINVKPAEFLRRYPDIFVMTGGGNVGLREVLGADAVSVPPPPPRAPKAVLEEAATNEDVLEAIVLTDSVYTEIHKRISANASVAAVAQRCQVICKLIEKATGFLTLEEVVLGGAAGKGICAAKTDAEIVLFVRKLPFKNFQQWLPHILDTLAPMLEHQLANHKAEKFKVEKDHLQFTLVSDGATKDLVIRLYVSPVFTDQAHLLESIRATLPAERFYFYPTMVKERNEFIGRQTQQTKTLIRLMTWWASRQKWSSSFASPSEWLMELIVIHVYQQLAEAGESRDLELADMANRVLEVFANFESIKVLWADSGTAHYQLQDIWRPLLSHEPLFMDPINPYCNLVDVNSFDAHELSVNAQPSTCLACFRREASRFMAIPQASDEDFSADDR